LAHLDPKQKNPKGAMTEAAVHVNAVQADLFPETVPVDKVSDDIPPYAFWILLIRIDDFEVTAELSLLGKMTGGKATFWLERIIVPSFRPNELVEMEREGGDDSGVDIDVPVERKSA
jgi:hypothetical protein